MQGQALGGDGRSESLAGSAVAEPPSYDKDIKPFLTKYCVQCHRDGKSKGGYNVEMYAALTKNGRKGPLLNMEEPERGRLLMSLEGRGRRMPPSRSPQPKAEEVAKIREWIKAGAPDDSTAAKHVK